MARKSNLIESAQKYQNRGQLDKAVKEYQRALKLDPKDLRVRQKLGSLHERRGDRAEAVKELTFVAEAYARDGFYLKAVAVYKQLLKIKRDLWDVHMKLGELYQQLNLAPEALEHFNYVAAYHETNGRWPECFEVYQRLVEINPDDLNQKIKLAELAARVERNELAIRLLREIAEAFKEQGQTQSLAQVYERLLTLSPTELDVLKELAEIYVGLGEYRRALSKLQICFKANATDVSTLSMLADVFYALDQTPKAMAVLKELARVHEHRGRQELRLKVFERIAVMDPTDVDARAALASARGGAPPAAPRSAPAPTPTPLAPPRQAPVGALDSAAGHADDDIAVQGELAKVDLATSRSLGEAQSLVLSGDLDGALRVLKERVIADPRCFRLHDRLRQALMSAGDVPGATRVSLMQVKLAVGARQVEPARRAAAIALALSPKDATVRMLTAKLGVSKPAEISLGHAKATSQEPPATETVAPVAVAPPPPVMSTPSEAVVPPPPVTQPSDGAADELVDDDDDDDLVASLIDTALEGEDEGNDRFDAAAIDDGLVEDEVMDDALAMALGDDDSDTGDAFDDGLVDDDAYDLDEDDEALMSLHLSAEDESITLVGVSAVGPGAFEPAVDTYEGELVRIDDDGSTANLEVASSFLDMGMPSDALAELSGMTLGGAGVWLMGRIQMALGDAPKAVTCFQQALSSTDLDPVVEAEVHFDLAAAFEGAGDDLRALEAYRQLFAQHRSFRPREVRRRISQITRRVQSSGGAPAQR